MTRENVSGLGGVLRQAGLGEFPDLGEAVGAGGGDNPFVEWIPCHVVDLATVGMDEGWIAITSTWLVRWHDGYGASNARVPSHGDPIQIACHHRTIA